MVEVCKELHHLNKIFVFRQRGVYNAEHCKMLDQSPAGIQMCSFSI